MAGSIRLEGQRATLQGTHYRLELDAERAEGVLGTAAGARLFAFPLDVKLVTTDGARHLGRALRMEARDHELAVSAAEPAKGLAAQRIIFRAEDAYLTVRFEAEMAEPLTLGDVELFRDPEMGMRVNHMRAGFCYPERPDTAESFLDLFPSATAYGLTSPPMLCMAMEFHHGFVGMGLLDLPDGGRFGVLNPFTTEGDAFTGLRVDSLGLQVTRQAGETYRSPEVAVTFPAERWETLRVFREVLAANRELPVVDINARPEWWKCPAYCTYGDQIMQLEPALFTDFYWGAPGFTQAWVLERVREARARLGWGGFPVVIDAFWQRPWDPDPRADEARFPDMRGLIDALHAEGHKVLLWTAPFRCGLKDDVGRLVRKHGIPLVARPKASVIEDAGMVDFTHPNAVAYMQEWCEGFFGDGPGCLNADGLKMDFVAALPRPERGDRLHDPAQGQGVRFVKRFLELLHGSATAVKPDVMLNYSASDPRLQHLFGANRLHDTRFSHVERERRARASAASCPELLIDSDGALMHTDWVAPTYIAAAVYSTPTLYYADRFSDGEPLPEAAMRTLGRLFTLCANRVWGAPEFVDEGSWRSRATDGRIVGESYDGRFCWLEQTDGTVQALGFEDFEGELCLHGRSVVRVTPEPAGWRIEAERVAGVWKGGTVYAVEVQA